MEAYQKLVRELIEDHISDRLDWDKKLTRGDVLKALAEDHENVFGNIDGSRAGS